MYDAARGQTNQLHSKSVEYGGLEVRVLPGSPNFAFLLFLFNEQQLTLHLGADVIAWLRRQGRGMQETLTPQLARRVLAMPL